MPYISEELKEKVDQCEFTIEEAVNMLIYIIRSKCKPDQLEGVCNYAISRIVSGSMKPETGWRYIWLNRAHGTFLSAAAEFYRRIVIPYEDKAIRKNGDLPEYMD